MPENLIFETKIVVKGEFPPHLTCTKEEYIEELKERVEETIKDILEDWLDIEFEKWTWR